MLDGPVDRGGGARETETQEAEQPLVDEEGDVESEEDELEEGEN
jgi:hypothetical protein